MHEHKQETQHVVMGFQRIIRCARTPRDLIHKRPYRDMLSTHNMRHSSLYNEAKHLGAITKIRNPFQYNLLAVSWTLETPLIAEADVASVSLLTVCVLQNSH